MSDSPASHITDSMKMESDGYVDLFKIELKPSGVLYLKNNDTKTWQGNTYEGIALQLRNEGASLDDQKYRPLLTIVNPEGMFSKLIASGATDKARVIRYRVLRAHLDTDQNIYQQSLWIVSRVTSLNRVTASFELRAATDGQFVSLPFRKFIPPNFPQVSLG